jgi:peptide/nickel transport system permease protein
MTSAEERHSKYDTDETLFETTSDITYGKREKVMRFVDAKILAPFRLFWNDWRGRTGIAILLTYVLMGTVGVMVIPEPSTDVANRFVQPFQSFQYPLGTDSSGHSMLATVVHGTPPILKMVLTGGVFSVTVGTLVGMTAGYKGGVVDQSLMLVTDVLMAIPGLPLVMVLGFVFEPSSPYLVGIILVVNAWAGLARSVRSQVLSLREESYIEASRVLGLSTSNVLREDILPGIMPYIAVSFVNSSRQVIFDSVALYFLGVLPTNQANWGVTMNLAYSSGGVLYSLQAIHWILVPMAAVVFFSLGLILIAQAADQLSNPRIRARHETRVGAEDESDGEQSDSASPVQRIH